MCVLARPEIYFFSFHCLKCRWLDLPNSHQTSVSACAEHKAKFCPHIFHWNLSGLNTVNGGATVSHNTLCRRLNVTLRRCRRPAQLRAELQRFWACWALEDGHVSVHSSHCIILNTVQKSKAEHIHKHSLFFFASHIYSSLVYTPSWVGKVMSWSQRICSLSVYFKLVLLSLSLSSSSSTLEQRRARQLKAKTLPSVKLCGPKWSPRMCTSGTRAHCTDVLLFIWWCLPCVKICCAAESKDSKVHCCFMTIYLSIDQLADLSL